MTSPSYFTDFAGRKRPGMGLVSGRCAPISLGRYRRAVTAALLAGGLLGTGGLLAGCGGAAGAASGAAGQTITLYNGQHLQTAQALVSAFEKKTGITVSIRSDDEDVLADQIVSEGARSPADVFYTENTPVLEFLQGKGLLSPMNHGTLADTPARLNSPQGDWAGVSARVSVMIYNPALISKSQLPTSVLRLGDPKYRGKLGLAAGETDFQPIVTSVLRSNGRNATQRWLKAVKANAAGHLYPDNETITSDVNRGTAAFALINQYYWYRLRAEIGASRIHSALAYFAPRDPGYVLDVSGVGVLKSSKHQAAAQKLAAFMLSAPGQEIIAHSDSFEYPIGSGVRTAAPETPFAQLAPNSITLADLGDGAAAIKLLQQAGLL